MKIKGIFLAMLSAVLLCFAPQTQVYAATGNSNDVVSPLYEVAGTASSELRISGSDATCKSNSRGDSAVKITAEQTLQKQGFLWLWSDVDGAYWTKTVSANSLTKYKK